MPSFSILVATLLQSTSASVPPPPPAPPPAVLERVAIKPGLEMITGGGGNVIVRSTPEGVVLIDAKSQSPAIYSALTEEIGEISAAPVRYVINTHYHGDHTGNDASFVADGASVVAQTGFKRELQNFVPPPFNPKEQPAPLPQVLYDNERDIALGGAEIEVMFLGAGHTGSDSYVYFPDLKVLAFGDQLVTSPLLDYRGGASLPAWIATLDRALALDWDTALPGHGPVMGRADVTAFRDKLQTLLDRARAAAAAGTPKDKLFEAIEHDDLFPMMAPFYMMPAQREGLYRDAISAGTAD